MNKILYVETAILTMEHLPCPSHASAASNFGTKCTEFSMSLNKYQTAPKKKKKKALFADIVHKNIQSKFRRVAYKRELTRFL